MLKQYLGILCAIVMLSGACAIEHDVLPGEEIILEDPSDDAS